MLAPWYHIALNNDRTGIVCGAGDLIDNFRRLLTELLEGVAKEYLETKRQQSLEQIVDDAVFHFRSKIKSFTHGSGPRDDDRSEWVHVSSLEKDTSRGFGINGFQITR